jgi:serine/threonine protein kinase/tetratricopeptide (TPR) repeat protein
VSEESGTPERFDRYRIVRILGKGGMGIVYLADDELLSRPVALKVLHRFEGAAPDLNTRFLREARAAAQIRHPNVATIYEVGEATGARPFISMEYCEGEPLSQLVRREPVDTARFIDIGRQIASAIAAAHKNGVIHRDIKSSNIIVEPGNVVKVLDFGLAKIQSVPAATSDPTETASGGFFGTLPYLSPEQARGLQADARSDLFALGVVLYEMASGVLPFEADSALALLEKIRSSEPRPFVPVDPNFPQSAAAIITRLLQKDPRNRYASAQEVVEGFGEIEEQFMTTARQSKALTPTTGLTQTIRNSAIPARNWLILALAMAVVITIGTLMVRPRQSGTPTPAADAAAAGPIDSLAVLPFQNISGAASEEFLSVGLADALTTQLQQIGGLGVRPTSAVLEFHEDESVDPIEAGRKLQVDSVLEGRFLSSGQTVRVSLQLTDTRTGYSVWAANVEGNRENLIALMDDVASSTRRALQTKLSSSEPTGRSEPRTDNPKAYEFFLRARALQGSLVADDNQDQMELLREAIALDPEFAAAYADLGTAMVLAQIRGFTAEADTYKRADWYARQAVRLDPNLPEAHVALARTLIRFPDRYRESMRETLAALRLNPSEPEALYSLASYFVASGDLQRAACIGDRIVEVNPTSNMARTRGYAYVNAVDPEGIMRVVDQALASPETELAGQDMLANAHLLRGDIAAAEAAGRRLLDIAPDHYLGKSIMMLVAADRGDRETVERRLREMEADVRTNHWATLRAALAWARLGEREKAVAHMRRAIELGNHSWYFLVKHPWLEDLQGDSEYQQLIGKLKTDLEDVRDDVIGVYELICPSGRR